MSKKYTNKGYSVFRKKRGSLHELQYTAKLKLYGTTKWITWPTGCTTERQAEEAARKEKERRDNETLQIAPPAGAAPVAPVVLLDHLPAFKQSHASEFDPGHTQIMVERLKAFFRETKIRTAAQLTAPVFEKWRDACGATLPKRSNKTKNDWLSTVRVYMDFLRRRDWVKSNPLKEVEPLSIKGKETFKRGAMTVPQIVRLLDVAGPRAAFYMVSLFTGLRRGALYKMTWAQVHLDTAGDFGPYIDLPAKNAKNRTADIKAIPLELVPILHAYRPKDAKPADRVFGCKKLPDGTILLPSKSLTFWKNDLEKAGIEFETPERRLDFHTIRHTTGTLGAVVAESPGALQALMSHKTAAMTAIYTHTQHLPQKNVANSLATHVFSAIAQSGAHGRVQSGVQTGLFLSTRVHGEKSKMPQIPMKNPQILGKEAAGLKRRGWDSNPR